MRIDNSQLKAWFFCPKFWEERYGNNLEPIHRGGDGLSFGTRMHQLLEGRHRRMAGMEETEYPALGDAALEAEAQMTFAGYEAHWGEEPFEVVGVEQYFEVKLPCLRGHQGDCFYYKCEGHTYCGEFDAIVREAGKLKLLETKTEKRGSKDNLPQAWQQKTQVGLYLWAAEQVYKAQFDGIILNIITRQSPKGQERPGYRRDLLERTREQQHEAVQTISYVADQIERAQLGGWFPPNRNNCVSPWGWACEYLNLHQAEGRPSEQVVQIQYRQAEKYLAGF